MHRLFKTMSARSQRTVLLTGAAGGIGQALAHGLAKQGASLALADLDGDGLRRLAAGLPPDTTVHEIDLADSGQLDALISAVVQAHGGLEVLICNAGLTVHGRFSDLTPAEIDRVLDVDLRSVVHLVSRALPHLHATPGSHIVLMSSMAGLQSFPFQAVYSTAKRGLIGFGDALRIELAPHQIGVTTVMPGTISTGFLDNAGEHDPATTHRLSALMKQWGTPPQRVANATLKGMARNRGRVRVGWDAHALAAVQLLLPPALPLFLSWAANRRLLGTP
jgi:short-subunit dehydrogenase